MTTTALLATSFLPGRGAAQDAPEEEARPFDFDMLTARAEELAGAPYAAPEPAEGLPEGLSYDLYRQIAFDPTAARWDFPGSNFRLHAFHLGWLFPAAVPLHDVDGGTEQDFVFTTDDFDYRHEAADVLPPHAELPGVAGFRIHYPLNRADIYDELLAFQGASYFRALGRGNAYGLSARGLAIDTASERPEEFPTFIEFYLERPAPGARTITFYALLDSPSVAGAYRFVVTPGRETAMDVTARLRFRTDVANLGVAPLTSMFLFSEANRSAFDDYRPQVHDSEGLIIERGDGDVLWRALNNPPRLSKSIFSEPDARAFGLYQRDRRFESYQDAGAHYQDRPSIRVERQGDWGPGTVQLVEIPTDIEANDNIVAYWQPDESPRAGEAREYSYRLVWGMMMPEDGTRLAHVAETRTGQGGISGVPYEGQARKFVVDFEGGLLARMAPDAEVVPQITVTGGEVVDPVLFKIEGTGTWRLAFDVEPASETEPGAVIELMAHVEGYDQRLTEIWMFQSMPTV
ncbi:glucans biosynthesis protein [Palleronia aestuarii]|uniref:Glucans biosynthesis protein n=1 Tax=Palleronia aestuarii TaxID=568105 RepID=A0A2W7NIS3_9RHOB|nr:glucan biosynthesis protein [Palleronia aestuarii]PZX13086.1 glucans biosynthesis protein [Palleronia aestuarii]